MIIKIFIKIYFNILWGIHNLMQYLSNEELYLNFNSISASIDVSNYIPI